MAGKLFIGVGDLQVRKDMVKVIKQVGRSPDKTGFIRFSLTDGTWADTDSMLIVEVGKLFAEFTQELNNQ